MASGYPTLPKQVLGSLAVGSVVKLDLDGVATEFLVVNQGMPSGLYDVSCNRHNKNTVGITAYHVWSYELYLLFPGRYARR